jgi:hypothetical protein
MSLTRIGTVIRNPFTGKAITAKAPVDTGNILTAVPRRAADELQLPVIGRRRVATAKSAAELDECIGIVEMTPLPVSKRRGFTLGVSIVTPSLEVTKNPGRAGFINLSHVVGQNLTIMSWAGRPTYTCSHQTT